MPERNERDPYVRRVLDQYRQLPGTLDHVRRTDRRRAEQLHRRGVPLSLVEAAFILATCRRLFRSVDAEPLEPVRTMHYYADSRLMPAPRAPAVALASPVAERAA